MIKFKKMPLIYFIYILIFTNIIPEEKTKIFDPKIITEIRNEYNFVQKNLNKYKQTKIRYKHNSEKENQDFFEEDIYYYTYKNQIIQITGDLVGDCAGLVNELTYKNQKLIFIYSYNWVSCKREIKTDEDRYYFKNEKLIHWIGKDEDEKNNIWNKKEKELLELSRFYKKTNRFKN